MSQIERAKIFGKLNRVAYQSLESATVFCKLRGNPYVELAHWIHQLLQKEDSDLVRMIHYWGLDSPVMAKEVVAFLDRLPRGATSIQDFSPHLEEAVERAWIFASLLFDQNSVRSGHLLVALLRTEPLRGLLVSLSSQFASLPVDALAEQFEDATAGSEEASLPGTEVLSSTPPGEASGAVPAASGPSEALAAYSENLTEAAAKGRLDPVIGRDAEIRQVLDILMRRRQNNPLLVGEAGVGKTAVVEGLAGRIAAGDVPPAFREVQLHALDVGSLQAGASMKGEFESRLKQLIAEVQASEKPIILFIDEAHTLVGAGGSPGQGDAANLLKPALARGNLRTIGATTFREFKKHIEKDPALTRRFQTIAVSEPDNETCTNMLRGVARRLADHHGVEVYDEAIGAAVELSRRYLPERQLPDKAVSLLDTACARVAVSQHTDAAPLESACRRVELLQTEREVVERESKVGHRDEERLTALDWEIESAARERDRIRERFRREKKIVDEILGIHRDLLTAEVPPTESSSEGSAAVVPSDESREGEPETATGDPQERLRTLRAELAELQGEEPMVFPALEAGTIAGVISEWTGIPVGRMVRDEIRSLLQLEQDLQQRVVGQNHALARISERIRVSRAGLEDPRKPIGVFLLVGPSGTGKTETALALAERLYGGEQNLITINMSEYQEAHTVSTLRGSPPGYVGYGEGGVLTEAVRRRPYSVVLLDEVEKAHPDVHEIFYQVFDKGTLQDSEGRSVDFRNTILLLTSNTGSDLAMKICADPQLRPEPDAYAEALRDSLREVFPAALLGRLNVVPYYPLDTEAMDLIIELAVGRVRDRLAENYGVDLVCSPEVSSLIRERCTEVESGGRMIESILNTNLLPRLSRSLLRQQMEGRTAGRMEVSVDRSEFRVFFAEE